MKVIDRTNRRSVPSGVRVRGARYLAMSSALILFGLYSSCGGGGGGGGGGSCANTLNIEGDWIFALTVTSATGTGDCDGYVPGDIITTYGFITQAGRAITFRIYPGADPDTGEVCGDNMDLHTQACGFYGNCTTEDMFGTISADTNTIVGDAFVDQYYNGVVVCSLEGVVIGDRASLTGGGDGENGASVFNYDDEATALVFARSTDSSPTRTHKLGAVLPREGGEFPLPPGYWDLYMTYPGELSRHFELAR